MNSDFVLCDVPVPATLVRSRRGRFIAAIVATTFYTGAPTWAASGNLTDLHTASTGTSGVSKMGALNSALSTVIDKGQTSASPVTARNSLRDASFGLNTLDEQTRLLMADLSRMALSQAAAGRTAGAGLMWADVALSDKAIRNAGFARPLSNTSRFLSANYEYSNSPSSQSALRLVAQEVSAQGVTLPKAPAKIAQNKRKASSSNLAPAIPVVTRAEAGSPKTSAATTIAAPAILHGIASNSTPSRAGIKAGQRLVSVSPLQSHEALAARKNVSVGMKKVITVASLKQLPPASKPLPTSYAGSRRAFVIPVGADTPPLNSRAAGSFSSNVGSTSAINNPSPQTAPVRPMSTSRMANQLEVAVGTFVVLQTATDLDTVAIAEPGIADVAVVNSRAVLVNGKTPGITSLVIVDRDKIRQYQVRVVSAPGTLPRDVVAQIGLPGVSVRQVRDALVLEGEVENAEEARRATEIAGIYSKKIVNNLTVRGVPTGDTAIAARLQGLIGLPNVTVSLLGDSVLLQGTVDSSAQKVRAEQVAAVSGRKVVNLIESPLLSVEEVQASFSSALAPGAATVGADGTPIGGIDPSSITVRRVGDQIVLEGNALDQARIDQAIAIASRSGLQVVNRLQILPPVPPEARILQSITSAIGIPGVTAYGSPKRLVLRGTVPDSNVANAAVQIARAYATEVDNMMVTPNPIQIGIDVQIVEINSDKARNLGVQFGSVALLSETVSPVTNTITPNPIAGQPPIERTNGGDTTRTIDPTFRQGQFLGGSFAGFGGFSSLDPFRARLQALYSDGTARLLSNPRSTVLSGRTATFQVGGQVPVPTGSTTNASGTTTTIEFKDFGVLLEANPVGNNDGIVTMRLRTEVSAPDPSLGFVPAGGAGLIPGFSRRQSVTEITVNRGGTIALGGLIQNNVTETVSRIPVLSKIPILGKLFQSKEFQRNQSELVIFVTPRVLPNSIPAGSLAPAGVSISDNTVNKGTQLGNPGIASFDTGDSIAPPTSGR